MTFDFDHGYADACHKALRRAGYSVAFSAVPPRLVRVVASRPVRPDSKEDFLPQVVSVGQTEGEALHRVCALAGVQPLG